MSRKIPTSVNITIGLMLAVSVVWFLFGLLTVMNCVMSIPVGVVRCAIGFTAIGFALTAALAAFFLRKRNRLVYLATIALFGMLLMVSFFDELGWTDILLICATTATLTLLIKDRRWFLRDEQAGSNHSVL